MDLLRIQTNNKIKMQSRYALSKKIFITCDVAPEIFVYIKAAAIKTVIGVATCKLFLAAKVDLRHQTVHVYT